MRYFIAGITGFSGGLVVGGGIVAFFTILGIITHIINLGATSQYYRLYQISIILGALISTLIYFFDIKISINKYVLVVLGLFMGIFIGIIASALAEMLDVISVIADRLKMLKYIYVGIFAIMLGKVFGSIIYWIVPDF